jgi:hypothetical protein
MAAAIFDAREKFYATIFINYNQFLPYVYD